MSKLYEPLQIGGMEIKNRTFMAPMSLGYESEDGTVNERMQAYWLARARGGVGCIITDALSVDPRVPYLGNTLCFRGEESIAAYKQFTDKVHACGAKIIPQVTHPGPESISAFFGIPPVASSAYINSMGQTTRALDISELPAIIAQYAETALNAKRAGFDGIELHCAHAYMLLGSFLSPMRNKRTDEYGGTLENRARLLTEVLDAIRSSCGKDFPIILRMSGSERDEQGNTLEDMKYLVPILEAHGVDAFEVSGGTQYERCNKIIPCHGEVRGINVKEAAEIRAAASVPVIVVGKINESPHAEQLVDSGMVDGIVLGRALIADPDFVNKARNGLSIQIAPCTACGVGCVGEQTQRRPGSCVINPLAGRELEFDLETPAANPERIAVVGGGIGGMAAARAFAMKGHSVTLFEKTAQLGGQINSACIPPHKQELSRWIVFLRNELARLKVDVKLNCCATKDVLNELHPDRIIVATGAREIVPPISGVDVETAITAQQVLTQKVSIPGGNVLIVGGGTVGLETAELLMHQKRGYMQVTVIEMTDSIGGALIPNNLLPMMKRLSGEGVRLMSGAKLLKADGGNVEIEVHGVPTTMPGFTHIIFACGSMPDCSLCDELKDVCENLICIGDANGVRQALEAVREGVEAAALIK